MGATRLRQDSSTGPTDRRATIREVARRSGVSVGTVSRALNGYADVAEPTRARVRQVATQLGYRPASAARTLVTRRSQVVGVFLETGDDRPDLQHPFFLEVLVGLKDALGRAGYDLLLFASRDGSEAPGTTGTAGGGEGRQGRAGGPGPGERSCLDRCRQHNVDGAVVMGLIDETEATRLAGSEVPCVGIDVVLGEGAACVTSDNRAGARMAVDLLHRQGHRRIATITGLPDTRPGRDRLTGYREALQAHGLPGREEYVVHGDYYADSGRQGIARLLDLDDPPTAVFVASDLTAIGVVGAAAAAGVRVPEDLAVVGFDDIALAEHVHPALTTVRQDKVRLGTEAGDTLVRAVEGGPAGPVTVPVELVVRGTTGDAT